VIPYTLAAGASSAPIVPPVDTPVFIVANNTSPGDRGTASMSLEHVGGGFLEWSGLDSPGAKASKTEGGFSAGPSTDMLFIDFDGKVSLQVTSTDTFVIHNATGATESGVILML
jgi:hypothetical protein